MLIKRYSGLKLEMSTLIRLFIVMVSIGVSSCATQKLYHGVEATDLEQLSYGMNRIDVEKYTGEQKRQFLCDYGTIVTYVYDRGYVGCIETKICDQERESKAKAGEVFFDIFSLGMMSMALTKCLMPCQKGHLEIFFDKNDRMIGARELPTDRDDYCWTGRSDTCEGYYNNRLPSSISKNLILDIDPEDIPEKICDVFKK